MYSHTYINWKGLARVGVIAGGYQMLYFINRLVCLMQAKKRQPIIDASDNKISIDAIYNKTLASTK
jgi:hypothetical protein